jgi:hypothetical protein
MTGRPVHLILDTSAIAAYAASVDVGETINEVCENGASFALPVACLAEATRFLSIDVLDLLADNDAAVLVGLASDAWRPLAAMRMVLSRLDAAAAFAAAEAHDCDILTAEPQLYAPLGDDPPVIPIN